MDYMPSTSSDLLVDHGAASDCATPSGPLHNQPIGAVDVPIPDSLPAGTDAASSDATPSTAPNNAPPAPESDHDGPDESALQPSRSSPPRQDDHRESPSSTSAPVPNPPRRSSRPTIPPARLINEQSLLCTEPSSYSEAVKSSEKDHWQLAMKNEFDSLQRNKTWTLCQLPQGRSPIKSKWIFKIKMNADGQVDRYKARLVAQGFSQKYGVDYNETFSPVATLATIRTLIGLKARGYTVHHVDVDTAYLNADLDTEIYLTQPQGFEVHDEQGKALVCCLNKAIYGLKQAGLLGTVIFEIFF